MAGNKNSGNRSRSLFVRFRGQVNGGHSGYVSQACGLRGKRIGVTLSGAPGEQTLCIRTSSRGPTLVQADGNFSVYVNIALAAGTERIPLVRAENGDLIGTLRGKS